MPYFVTEITKSLYLMRSVFHFKARWLASVQTNLSGSAKMNRPAAAKTFLNLINFYTVTCWIAQHDSWAPFTSFSVSVTDVLIRPDVLIFTQNMFFYLLCLFTFCYWFPCKTLVSLLFRGASILLNSFILLTLDTVATSHCFAVFSSLGSSPGEER